ncbi:MAG: protein tyrosine phosphatase family protein [Pseudomonadota bacterium]
MHTEIYNFEAITDWLGTSGQPQAAQFAGIAQAGYKAVINLAMPDSDNAIADEGRLVTEHGMAYFHIPVDFAAPTVDDLRLFFGVMQALDGQRVWVHCVVNARVSAFVYQYLPHVRGFSEADAQTRLLKRWLPQMDDVWRAFIDIPASSI